MRNFGIIVLFVCASVGYVSSQDDAPAMWSLDQVVNMVQPVALYPDALLANVLDACTNPGAIVAASDYLNQPAGSRGAPDAGWPASIQALVKYPAVVSMLDGQLSWATRLGTTYKTQPNTVKDAVNSVRRKAQAAGNLTSNEYQNVAQSGDGYTITAVNPADCWVPYYDPAEIYYSGYAYAWRRGVVQGYYWQGKPMPYHPYAHPYHPAYNPAFSPAYNYGGYHPEHHEQQIHYGGMGVDRGFGGGRRR